MSCRLLASLAMVVMAGTAGNMRPAIADWPPEGVSLCAPGVCDANTLVVTCPDGFGGAFVYWQDYRSGNADLYAQRVTASGEIAPGWPANGLPICTNPAFQSRSTWSMAPDGLGGMLVSWLDFRNAGGGPTSVDIYAQRVMADGTLAPGWAVDGMPVTRRPGYQSAPVVVADGTGGGYFSWDHISAGPRDIHLQRLTANGVPAPGWPSDGLPVCTADADQGGPQLASDGSAGVILAWGDLRDGPLAVYAQRELADGNLASGWPVNGARIVLGRGIRELVSDGTGGAYLACLTPGPIVDDDYYLQRFTGAGTISPGWPEGGALVCAAAGQRAGLRMSPDAYGGAHLAWYDFRGTSDEIYAMRMQADGTRAPGWPADGLRVTNLQTGDYSPIPAADGLGGVYLAWDRNTGGLEEIMLHHVSGAGAVVPGWPVNGLVVPGSVGSVHPEITEDGYGGAIAVWQRADGTVRALRIGVSGPVAVAISLVSAEAEVGRVRLVWFAADVASLAARVERRTETGEWQTLTTLTPDGVGRIEYEDRDVTPGTRYAYRLAYSEDGTERATEEIWVSVPRLELALRGFQPNPSVGIPTVALVLAESAPASLEVFDVVGRRVASRAVGAMGPGRHVIPLDTAARLTPGVYAIRLTQGERVLMARGVVTR